jgi:hypothetical protein
MIHEPYADICVWFSGAPDVYALMSHCEIQRAQQITPLVHNSANGQKNESLRF